MLNFCLMLKSPSLTTSVSSCNNGRGGSCSVYWRRRRKAPVLLQVSAASYQKFVDFAVNETKRHAVLAPSPLQVQLSLVCIWIFTLVGFLLGCFDLGFLFLFLGKWSLWLGAVLRVLLSYGCVFEIVLWRYS